MDIQSQIEFWNKTTKIISKYFEENERRDTPVLEYQSAKALLQNLNLNLSKQHSEEDILTEVEQFLKLSPRTSHPQFNNQLYGGLNIYSLVGEIISFLTNTSMATFEISPVATIIENTLIENLNSKIGFNSGDGIMVTGGSNANLMAVHCARNKMYPDTKTKGNPAKDLCVFVSKDAHYSFQKAILLLGIGTDNLILIDTNDKGELSPVDLEEKIKLAIKENKSPIMIASTAGSTVLGSFDPIQEIDVIAKKYKIWHHVDGAWGGAVLFSSKHKELMKGIENVDSFTFDAHKLLGTGLITSFFLTKSKGELYSANSAGGKKYLFHEYENAEFDTGKSSLQCGRKVDSLKVWLYWKSLGDKGIENYVDQQLSKAHYLKEKILANNKFKLVNEVDYLNVCFQVIPEDITIDINDFNYKLRYEIIREGRIMINFSRFDNGLVFFRFVFANNKTKKEDLDFMLEYIGEKALTFRYINS